MADYKDYIVRYDITADVTKAAEGLQSIANVAKEFEVPMKTLSDAIRQVSQSAFQLKQNSNITFAPKIDVGAFNNQLRNMVLQVRSAATEMHAAIFEALTGNASATKAMQKGVTSAIGGTKSVKDLKSDIAAYNKELDQLLGTPITKKGKTTRNRDGSIQMAKNAKMDDRVLELESRKRMLQSLIKQRKSDLVIAEKLEKEAASKQASTSSKPQTKTATITQPQPAKLTNVTPAVIREWKKAFGDARGKTLTVNIKGNAGGANGALTVIKQVQSSLEALQTMGTFNINPVLNMEAFAAAEAQLKRLAALSSSVTAPFIAKDEKAQGSKLGTPVTSLTKDEKSKLSEAKKQVKNWNDKINKVQTRLDTNKTKYEQAPTPGLKGQITRDTKTLEQYKASKAEQESIVSTIKGKTTSAVQSSAKGVKPFSIDIIGNLKDIKVTGKIPAIPVNVKIMADQVASSLQSIPRPTLTVDVRLNTNGVNQQLQNATRKTKSAAKGTVTKATTAKVAAPVVATNTQQKGANAKVPPVSLKLDTTEAIAKLEEFIALIKANSPQNIKLTASGTTISAATKSASSSVTAPTTSGGNKGKNTSGNTDKNKPLTAQERYARQKETAAKNYASSKTGGQYMVRKGQEYRAQQQTWYSRQQAMYNRLFEAVPKPDYGWAMRAEQHRASELATMRNDATAAFAKPTPFEQKETAAKNKAVSNSIAKHQQQAAKLRARAYNSALPFAQNKEQANMMAKHRKYFRQAVTSTGITPTPGMESSQMLKYLQGVSTQMQSASVPVPWQLQSQINKLEGQASKPKGVNADSVNKRPLMAAGNQKSFFDQSRRWAYPFTGQTSFGVRTPMAVDMAKGMGVMFAIGGAMSAVGDSFSQAMEYQNTMRTTQAILQNGTDSYSKSSFKNMENTVRDVGIKTKFSAPEVADAARFLAMAGYDIEAINASIRPIADLALIGDSDLGETADKMTNIMTTFQIAPENMRAAANIMATTATRSNTDLMMLAESAKYGGGVANMYGRNDPNLFADTMALFGVMGNAGVQASSAGTALRMMYQNIFKPNKNQKAVLEMMNKKYGITTTKEDGNYRSMSDILVDMAQRIPENKMAEIVGNLFRITAQPGATAALLAAAGGDANTAQEIGVGIDAMSEKMSSKDGLSALVSLMLANRRSMSGHISESIAEEKQNTIQGLWAQVTSTFTEGIVKSFEKRQGGLEEMLRNLRDYFAKPETVSMIQNLIDMIIEIGKVLAWFAKVWANLYNMAPGMIKCWVTIQMFFTQIGTLISPVVSLIGVFNRLGGAISKLSGVSMIGAATVAKTATGRVIANSTTNTALLGSTFAVGAGNVIRGGVAARANRELASNAILAGELALSGASRNDTLNSLNNGTRQHYAEVQKRAKRIYGVKRVKRAFSSAFHAVPTMMAFTPMLGGLKSMLVGLLASLAKAIGFIMNPITLAVAALAGLGFGIYKLVQFVNGNTKSQILAQQEMAKHSAETTQAMLENSKWYLDQLDKFKNRAQQLESVGKSAKELEYEERANKFQSGLADIEDLTKNSSNKGTNQQVATWREKFEKNPLWKLAVGKEYDKLVGKDLTNNPTMQYTGTESDFYVALHNVFRGAKDKAKFVQENELQAYLMSFGVDDKNVQDAINQITELRNLYFKGKITEDEYYNKSYAIRGNVVNLNDPRLRSAAGLTMEQFRGISDPSLYKEYAQGQYNVITSFINGENGSTVGKMNAHEALMSDIKAYSGEWLNAIKQVIGDYPIAFNAVSDDGKMAKELQLSLSMLPDGKINYDDVIAQIKNSVEGFNGNIHDFANMAAKVYKMLADAGIKGMPNTKEGALEWTQRQLQNLPITAGDAASFFHNYVEDGNPLKKYGISVEEYQKYVRTPYGKITAGDKTYSAVDERKNIRKTIANKAVEQIFDGVPAFNGNGPLRPEYQNAGTNNAGNNATGNGNQSTPTPTPSPTDQNDYRSRYDNSSARSTQININIDKLAHFDRTTVAASAEERDLIAAMENKITEAVYRIFAEASNQAQSIIDLT